MVVLYVGPCNDSCRALVDFFQSFRPKVCAGFGCICGGMVATFDGSFKVFLGPWVTAIHRAAMDCILFQDGMCWVVCCCCVWMHAANIYRLVLTLVFG